jgi:hypothetical protein
LTQTDGVEWQIPLATASITTGGTITVTDAREFLHPNIAVGTAMLEADAVTGAKIADDAIDSEHYTDGSIDAAHIASNAVITAKILDSNVTAAKIANRTRRFLVPVVSVYNQTDTAMYPPITHQA